MPAAQQIDGQQISGTCRLRGGSEGLPGPLPTNAFFHRKKYRRPTSSPFLSGAKKNLIEVWKSSPRVSRWSQETLFGLAADFAPIRTNILFEPDRSL